MLSVTNMPFMLSVVMLNVIMLNAVVPYSEFGHILSLSSNLGPTLEASLYIQHLSRA
jgi:hypothetical protein